MRCTRCDEIAVPQAVGRAPDGRLIFGWCRECLETQGSALVEVPGTGLIVPPRGSRRRRWRSRWRRLWSRSRRRSPAWPRPRVRRARRWTRRSTVAMIAGAMVGWGLVLIGSGALGPWQREAAGLDADLVAPSPLGNGTTALMLVGGGMMVMAGLALTVAVMDLARWLPRALRAVPWISAAVFVSVLVWAIVDHDPKRGPMVVGVVALALAASWLARWFEHRYQRRLPVLPPLTDPGRRRPSSPL